MTTQGPIVLLLGPGEAGNMVFHALRRELDVQHVLVERHQSRASLFYRRAKRLGWPTALSQAAFVGCIAPVLRREGAAQRAAICREFALDASPIPERFLHRVSSVNDEQAVEQLVAWAPSVVLVFGTRLIRRSVLTRVTAPFINLHAGITPRYRGSHGAYWAALEGRPMFAGVTVHLIDPGIDTGAIVAQATIDVTPADNFATLPYRQFAAGVSLLAEAARAARAGTLATRESIDPAPSALWHHPTLGQYLRGRLSGVR